MSDYTGVAKGGGGFNRLAAGGKMYGSGRSMPTLGPVDPMGYAVRDRAAIARRTALLNQIKAWQAQSYMSPQWLGGPSVNGT